MRLYEETRKEQQITANLKYNMKKKEEEEQKLGGEGYKVEDIELDRMRFTSVNGGNHGNL